MYENALKNRVYFMSTTTMVTWSGFEGQGDRNGQSKPLNSEARVKAI